MGKRVLKRSLVCASLFLLVCSAQSFAQAPWMDGPVEEISQRFMQMEDKNGDGKVAIDEFGGPEEHFKAFDKNGDGGIDLTEAPKTAELPTQ